MDVDPYKLLGIPKIFTPEQLKTAYKKQALILHPDKQGGNDYMFKVLTACYKHLVKEYNKRIADKQFTQLKQESQKHTQQYVPVDDPKKSFNIEKFNQVFESNKVPDVVRDTGYNDWLKTGDADSKPSEFKGKFTNTAFNQQFEKTAQSEPTKHLIKYKEPEPMFACKKIQFTELGQDNIDDFSADNLSRKNLNYMDLKVAHTTSRIVDPKTVNERKSYKTVGDVEADRANISYNMSETELKEYHLRKRAEDEKEKQRVANLQAYDQRSLQHFERVNMLMLGRRQ